MANLFETIVLAASSTEPTALDFLGLEPGQRFVVILTALGCVTGVIVSLAGIIYSWVDGANKRRLDAELKRELLDRGMSVDEIVKVIEAVPASEDPARWLSPWCGKKK